MAADKLLQVVGGKVTEVQGNDSSAGAADAGKAVMLDGSGLISDTMLRDVESASFAATEDVASGDFVNVFLSGGVAKIRKADATTDKRAHGFVLAAILTGASGTVYFAGVNSGRTGLTIGSEYFLNTTAGGVTVTAPSATGNIVQNLGIASSATEIRFRPEFVAVRA